MLAATVEDGSPTLTGLLDICADPVDIKAARERYDHQDQFIVAQNILPAGVLETIIREAEEVRSQACRKSVPGYKASSSVSYDQIRQSCPGIDQLYRSDAFIRLLSDITTQPLLPCPARDMHAAAIYNYSRPGDAIGYHYDISHYKGVRITVLIGLVNQSESKLVCRLHTKSLVHQASDELEIATDPGTVVIFNGDRLLHKVTPLGNNQRRMVLSLQYVTSAHMSKGRLVLNDLKDAMTYFGFRRWLQRTWAGFRADPSSLPG